MDFLVSFATFVFGGVLFLFYGLDKSNVEATTCTKATDFTCPVTQFSKGTCLKQGNSGNCACTVGYSPGLYGCQKDLVRPHIRMTDEEAAPIGTGIFALMSLTCEPAKDDVTYTWTRDGAVIPETGATITHTGMRTARVETFRYSCQYSVNGRDSPESNVFELQVFARIEDIDPDQDKFKPVLRGVPTSVVEGTELNLTCANYIFHQVQRVQWSLPNGFFHGIEMTLKMTKGREDSDIFCTIVYSLDVPVESPTVHIPKMSDNIPYVVIQEGDQFMETGQDLHLTCTFMEEDFVTRGISITWGWSHQGVPVPSLTTQSITIPNVQHDVHAGAWQCSATYGSNAKRESPPIFVVIDVPIDITATATPARAIADGIMEIACEVHSSTPVVFTYGWTLNQEELVGYVDHKIFLNFADDIISSTMTGDYVCMVTVGQTIASSDVVTVSAPIDFSDSPSPTVQVKGNPQEFVYGNTYELECLSPEGYTVPGVQYEYFLDGVLLDNSTIVMNETGFQVVTCLAVFNDLQTHESNGLGLPVKGGPDTTLSANTTSTASSTPDAPTNHSVTETPSPSSPPPVNSSSPPTTLSSIETADNDTDVTTLPSIETADNDTDVTTPINGTTPSVRQDPMPSPTPNSTINPDTESTESDTVTRKILGVGPGLLSTQPTQIVLGHSENSSFFFNETYHLKCQLFDNKSHDGIEYEFFQDGVPLETSGSDMHTITNDVINREYTCRAVSPIMTSPMSNPVHVSFTVFDKVQITWKESNVTTCSAKVTLGCEVTLLPGVPDQVDRTWYDQNMDVIDKSHALTFTVTQGFLKTFYCKAKVGSHSETASLTVLVRGTDQHCSACSLPVCWTLMLIATTFIFSLH